MANLKITQLTADTAPTVDDLIIIVNDPAVTPANRKVTIGNLFRSLPDGSSTAPSLSFTSEPTLGIYRPSAGLLSITGRLGIARNGGNFFEFDYSPAPTSYNLRLDQEIAPGDVYWNFILRNNDMDYNILTLRQDKVGIGTTVPDGQLSTGLLNGQQISYKSLTELTTIAAAATTVTTIAIPANVIVKAVSVRVTTAIPTAATFTVIGNTSLTAFNTVAVGVAAGSTDKGNLNCPYGNVAAQSIRITPNATPADNSGRVRITIWYEDSVPPTS